MFSVLDFLSIAEVLEFQQCNKRCYQVITPHYLPSLTVGRMKLYLERRAATKQLLAGADSELERIIGQELQPQEPGFESARMQLRSTLGKLGELTLPVLPVARARVREWEASEWYDDHHKPIRWRNLKMSPQSSDVWSISIATEDADGKTRLRRGELKISLRQGGHGAHDVSRDPKTTVHLTMQPNAKGAVSLSAAHWHSGTFALSLTPRDRINHPDWWLRTLT